MGAPLSSVAVLGHGLAAWMAAAQLCRSLPGSVSVTVVGGRPDAPLDALYGAVMPPETYGFHTGLGISEPELVMATGTAFSFGTAVQDWGEQGLGWVQPFHLPLASLDGVPLHLLALRAGVSLQSLLISAQAGRAGRFAHPPEDRDHPLSRAEYGYLIDAPDIAALYRGRASRADVVDSAVARVERDGDTVTALRLENGRRVVADLFIDASGPDATLIGVPDRARTAAVTVSNAPVPDARSPIGLATARADGLRVQSATRTRLTELSVGGDGQAVAFLQQAESWRGNVVAVGQAACTVEPLNVAPMRLLLRDVARLVELFPVDADMRVEREQYAQSARDDQDHALAFHQAHFHGVDFGGGAYFSDAAAWSHPKLERKLTQFAGRGYLVGFDHEPFHPLDWAVLHDALGRRPARADALARQVPLPRIEAHLSDMAARVAATVPRMPPHAIYLAKLSDYLRRKPELGGRHAG